MKNLRSELVSRETRVSSSHAATTDRTGSSLDLGCPSPFTWAAQQSRGKPSSRLILYLEDGGHRRAVSPNVHVTPFTKAGNPELRHPREESAASG